MQGYLWDMSDAPRVNDRNPEDLFGAPIYYADRSMPIACMHCAETAKITSGGMNMYPMPAPSWDEGLEDDLTASMQPNGVYIFLLLVSLQIFRPPPILRFVLQ